MLAKRELPVVKTLRDAVRAARWEASGLGEQANELDDRLRAIEDTSLFKRKLKSYLLDKQSGIHIPEELL